MVSSEDRPDGAPQVLPYLYYADTRAAVEFLRIAFGFVEVKAVRDDEGNVWHADLSTGDGLVMLGPGMAEYGTAPISEAGPATARTFVYVDDVDALFRQAISAGASVIAAPSDQGPNRTCCLADCGGHQWIFGTPLGTTP